MKKIFWTAFLAFVSYFSYAQTNIFPLSGNAGLGTTTPPAIGNYGVLALNGSNISQGGYLSVMTNGTEVGAIVANSQFNIQTATGLVTQFYTGSTPTMQISGSGNVGIGTTSPGAKLSIVPDNSNDNTNYGKGLQIVRDNANTAQYISLVRSSGGVWSLGTDYNTSNFAIGGGQVTDANFTGSNSIKFLITSGGNVGIGTTNPSTKLEVDGTSLLASAGAGVETLKITGNDQSNTRIRLVNSSSATDWALVQGITGVSNRGLSFYDGTTGTTRMAIEETTGNVSIGTANPQGYKLAVNGSAIATSMTVKLNSAWPDYVFKPSYRLPSLAEIKTYIDLNQHLPDMPSEGEVAKDGLNLGEMNKLLTKKVEELTLYLIEKDKQLKEQDKRISALEAAMTVIKNK